MFCFLHKRLLASLAVGWGIACTVWGEPSQPAGTSFHTAVAASSEPLVAHAKYTLWIPARTKSVRCLFVINKRGAGKHLFYEDQEWRLLAERTGGAMLYSAFEAYGVRDNGYGASMLQACDQFAEELGRDALRQAPFVLWGHSMGGRVVQDFVRFAPSRVLAFHIALRSNPSSESFMREETEAMMVPGLYLMGMEDQKPADIREHFLRARKAGSPRAWIWLPGQQHWPRGMDFHQNKTTPEDWRAWGAHDVVIPWTEAVIQRRLPYQKDAMKGSTPMQPIRIEQGWLGDTQTGRIAPYDPFGTGQTEASWFPDHDTAKAWVAYAFPESSGSK